MPARVEHLIKVEGREVIIVGELNVCRETAGLLSWAFGEYEERVLGPSCSSMLEGVVL